MRTIGTTDLTVFPLCLGTNIFGWTTDERQAFDVLDAYVAAGGNFIDTADIYSPGSTATPAASPRRSSATGWRRAATATTSSSPPRSARRPASRASPRRRSAGRRGLARAAADRSDRPLLRAHGRRPTPLEETLGGVRRADRRGQGALHRCLQLHARRGWPRRCGWRARTALPAYVAIQPHYNLMRSRASTRARSPRCASARASPASRTTGWPRAS